MSRKTAVAIAWTLFILVLCWTPSRRLPMSESAPGFLKTIHVDKMVHCVAFAGFSSLWLRARDGRNPALIGLAGVALAVLTEVVQNTSLVGRDGDVWDALADSVGVALGLIVATRLARRSQARIASTEV